MLFSFLFLPTLASALNCSDVGPDDLVKVVLCHSWRNGGRCLLKVGVDPDVPAPFSEEEKASASSDFEEVTRPS